MQGKVEICGVNTSKLAVLDSATTRRLLLRVRQGDKSAREELIAGNLRLVLSVIQRFSSRGENIERSLSGRVHRSYQGHRQLRRRGAQRALFHLRRADDRRGDPPVSARQQRPARIAQRARYRVQNSAGAREAHRRDRPRADRGGDRSLSRHPPAGDRSSRSTRSATP